jgi:hypothetical protein
MRIYSSIKLSSSKLFYLSNAGRVYPGRWMDNYLYLIKSKEPNKIITYSPVDLLQENRNYYCYNKSGIYKRCESRKNVCEMTTINNKQELIIYIPKCVEPDDMILIHSPVPTGYQSAIYSNLFPYPILQ